MKSRLLLMICCFFTVIACDANRGVSQPEDVKLKVSKNSAQTGATIDYDKFKFSDRERFEDLMDARIDNVERGLKTLKKDSKLGVIDGSGISSTSTPPPDVVQRRMREITKVEHQKDLVEDQLDLIDDVKADQWERFRDGFRDDLVQLEKSYEDLYISQAK
ncbi:MAG TPA: hypothetical protein VM432_00250 [Bdellovibrionales bacterium]|nr:hypothetical protein [Bdellovibrionales bacterium]